MIKCSGLVRIFFYRCFFSIALVVSISCVSRGTFTKSNPKLVDGRIAEKGKFPGVVAFGKPENPDKAICTGAIVQGNYKKFLITAAHCVGEKYKSELETFGKGKKIKIFRATVSNPKEYLRKVRNDPEESHPEELDSEFRLLTIAQTHLHPLWLERMPDSKPSTLALAGKVPDVAFLEFEEKIDWEAYSLDLATNLKPKDEVILTGHGLRIVNADEYEVQLRGLRFVYGTILRTENCYCSLQRMDAALAPGDSGGPVFVGSKSDFKTLRIVGVNSSAGSIDAGTIARFDSGACGEKLAPWIRTTLGRQ
jgi:Trypsin